MSASFDAAPVLARLFDFQRRTAEHAFNRLYLDRDSTRRYLVADETGLGKTHVARGVIAKTIQLLQHDDTLNRIDIVYVCSNADIADQNLRKLAVIGDHRSTPATRLTLLVRQHDLLKPSAGGGPKPVTFVSFTPTTSFEFGWQTGRAEERAVLYQLLAPHLGVAGADATALKRILQGTITSLERFQRHIDRLRAADGRWEPSIRRAFLRAFDRSRTRRLLEALIAEVRHRGSLNRQQQNQARQLTVQLRQLLARASVRALEPDLIILDEFQRFRHLLDRNSDAGELAGHLFDQPDARVLLLSATPYKAFTYAEEAATDEHYAEFGRTLEFLANDPERVGGIRAALAELRRRTLAGDSVTEVRQQLERDLRRLLCRTERPAIDANGMLAQPRSRVDGVAPEDVAGYVALHRVAEAVDAPLTIEYWKSAPYFANFLDGYQLGDKLKHALRDGTRHQELRPLLRSLQRLHARDVETFQQLDWGNARLRRLAADTVQAGWWRLLWVPPSLPYHQGGGAYASADRDGAPMTKRLIFSSWVAAPSAIASLLSYEAERCINTAVGRFDNTSDARRAITARLSYRLEGGRPASMSSLALFWPTPTLAEVTDPLDAARSAPDRLPGIQELLAWARTRTASIIGPQGSSRTSASTAWHWAAPLLADATTPVGRALAGTDVTATVEALTGTLEEGEDATDTSRVLAAHVEAARRTLGGDPPDTERPTDLLQVVALLGLAAPGNVAWRALARFQQPQWAVTQLGHWQAATILASGLRSLFNRPEVTLLLDQLHPSEETAYWQTVAQYCLHGNLQAVLDEYLHHLAEAEGYDTSTDQGLRDLALAARRAMTIRPARYLAFDPDHPGDGMAFLSRFALRFGNIRQEQDDVRLPEVRAAFNSPFWPFVLATTSIGQEGVDFHWWCHAIVHWNLPANPVDFEQREGRIHRFKSHAIRRNVAAHYRTQALRSGTTDIWAALFHAAVAARDPGADDLQPYWIFPGPAAIERHILGYPLSRDQHRWQELSDLLALYRLAFGQPRQDDMVGLLMRRGLDSDPARIKELGLDLRPTGSDANPPI
jgi:hypothetical protein